MCLSSRSSPLLAVTGSVAHVSLVPIDWTQMRAALDRGANRVAALLRTAPDRNARVKGLEWSVADLGAHIVDEAERFERFGRGNSQPLGDVARVNADGIATVTERDPALQAGLFLENHARYMALAKEHQGTDPYVWFDTKLEWAEAAGIYLGELCIHALDLARTQGLKAPIAREDALNVAYGLLPILPSFVDKETAQGFSGTFKLALRGGTPLLLTFTDGELSVGRARREADSADCTISADPEAFLLVGYGRASQWGPILHGKIFASGRKPWLGLRFSSLLMNP
jgi:uncharacterized protein (TIGR03083 family)